MHIRAVRPAILAALVAISAPLWLMLLTPGADARVANRAVQKQPLYAGKWGLDHSECRRGQPSVRITANKLIDVDATCTFKSVYAGPSAWTIRAICVTFDQHVNEVMTLWATKTAMTVTYREIGPQRFNYVRCG